MDKKMAKITKEYEKFNIPKEQIPSYKNPNQFAKTFKQCSIVEYKNISYSNTTVQTDVSRKK
ncbi:MAG: hypothetical protein HZC10_03285 [Nitrospirae bacterium]|nr:hypothetical protein [Nitrospirota bacterium]